MIVQELSSLGGGLHSPSALVLNEIVEYFIKVLTFACVKYPCNT